MQEQEFRDREDTIRAFQKLVPTASMRMRDGAVLFAVLIPWQLAGAIVKHLNTANIRRMDHRWAADLGQDMTAGRWASCYDPVAFTAAWVLYNGQHRLFASWRAQQDQYWIVVTGGAPDMQKSTDGGKKRSIRQTHGLAGTVASVVSFVMLLEARSKGSGITRAAKLARHAESPGTFEHYSAYFGRFPLLRESHIAAAFAFAEICRPVDSGRLRGLAEDIGEGRLTCQASKLIDRQITDRRKVGIAMHQVAGRYAEACLILRGIQAHLLGADLTKLDAHPGTLNWFDPVYCAKASA